MASHINRLILVQSCFSLELKSYKQHTQLREGIYLHPANLFVVHVEQKFDYREQQPP